MINVIINNKECKTEKGKSILQTALENGIYIPSLCNCQFLKPAGVCRLCLVEITKNGRKKIVTSCNYEVEDGLEVITDSDEIFETRKWILKLLLARCPDADIIRKLAYNYGIKETGFIIEDDKCILCGLCVRMCEERMGRSAINFIGRGIERKIDTPWKYTKELVEKNRSQIHISIQTDYCMACGACASVCSISPGGPECTGYRPGYVYSFSHREVRDLCRQLSFRGNQL
jgi:NADH dehydrogenase/NADH:ubiquinone oxidoreductase subunit G